MQQIDFREVPKKLLLKLRRIYHNALISQNILVDKLSIGYDH